MKKYTIFIRHGILIFSIFLLVFTSVACSSKTKESSQGEHSTKTKTLSQNENSTKRKITAELAPGFLRLFSESPTKRVIIEKDIKKLGYYDIFYFDRNKRDVEGVKHIICTGVEVVDRTTLISKLSQYFGYADDEATQQKKVDYIQKVDNKTIEPGEFETPYISKEPEPDPTQRFSVKRIYGELASFLFDSRSFPVDISPVTKPHEHSYNISYYGTMQDVYGKQFTVAMPPMEKLPNGKWRPKEVTLIADNGQGYFSISDAINPHILTFCKEDLEKVKDMLEKKLNTPLVKAFGAEAYNAKYESGNDVNKWKEELAKVEDYLKIINNFEYTADKEKYIKNNISLTNMEVKEESRGSAYREVTYYNKEGRPATYKYLSGVVTNNGNRTIAYLEVTVYALDMDGKRIAKRTYGSPTDCEILKIHEKENAWVSYGPKIDLPSFWDIYIPLFEPNSSKEFRFELHFQEMWTGKIETEITDVVFKEDLKNILTEIKKDKENMIDDLQAEPDSSSQGGITEAQECLNRINDLMQNLGN